MQEKSRQVTEQGETRSGKEAFKVFFFFLVVVVQGGLGPENQF